VDAYWAHKNTTRSDSGVHSNRTLTDYHGCLVHSRVPDLYGGLALDEFGGHTGRLGDCLQHERQLGSGHDWPRMDEGIGIEKPSDSVREVLLGDFPLELAKAARLGITEVVPRLVVHQSTA